MDKLQVSVEARESAFAYLNTVIKSTGVSVDNSHKSFKIIRYCFDSSRSPGAVEEHFAYLTMDPIDDFQDEASFIAMQRKPVTVLDVQEHPVVDKRKPIVAYERTWPINKTTERLIATFGASLTGQGRGPTLLFGGRPEGCPPISGDYEQALANRWAELGSSRAMARHDWKEDPWLDPLEFWHFASMVFVYRSVHEFVEHLVVFPLKFGQTLTDAAQTYLRNYLSSDKELKCVGSQEFEGHDMLIHSGQIAFMTLRDPSVGIEEYVDLFSK